MFNFDLMEYNTTREHLINREYGRHIQKMVDYILTIEDREKRTKNAFAVVELMGFLNPHIKQEEDYERKLWDHLYIMSGFELDVDSPFPKPDPTIISKKPEPVAYPNQNPKYHHLGKNLELLIDKALKEEDEEKRQGLANAIAYYMKLTYSTWHGELVHDDNIRAELTSLSQGELQFDTKLFIKHRTKATFETLTGSSSYPRKNSSRNGRNNGGGRNGGRKHGRKKH